MSYTLKDIKNHLETTTHLGFVGTNFLSALSLSRVYYTRSPRYSVKWHRPRAVLSRFEIFSLSPPLSLGNCKNQTISSRDEAARIKSRKENYISLCFTIVIFVGCSQARVLIQKSFDNEARVITRATHLMYLELLQTITHGSAPPTYRGLSSKLRGVHILQPPHIVCGCECNLYRALPFRWFFPRAYIPTRTRVKNKTVNTPSRACVTNFHKFLRWSPSLFPSPSHFKSRYFTFTIFNNPLRDIRWEIFPDFIFKASNHSLTLCVFFFFQTPTGARFGAYSVRSRYSTLLEDMSGYTCTCNAKSAPEIRTNKCIKSDLER